MEVCAGFELIAIENTTTRGDDLLEIGKGREAQMIRRMQPWLASATPRIQDRTPSPGGRITRVHP